jgi:hypothetical protein
VPRRRAATPGAALGILASLLSPAAPRAAAARPSTAECRALPQSRPAGLCGRLQIGRDHTLENADRGRGIARAGVTGNADEYQALLNCGWPPLGP